MQHEIFIAGTRADNSGKTITITPDEVASIAKSYHPSAHEAPIVIGHPSDNAPAYGWVKSLSAKDGKLFAQFGEMDDEFVGLVKQGRYKKVSASFYPPKHPSNPKPDGWYLRHVGFLGATPPAVKGLSAINFHDDGAGVVCFGELSDIEQFVANFQHGLDKLGQILKGANFHENTAHTPSDEQYHGADDHATPSDSHTPKDNHTQSSPQDNNPTTPNPDSGVNQMKELDEAIKRAEKAEAELAEFKAKQAQEQRDNAGKANSDFAENLVKDGKIKPCDKELLTQVLNFAQFPADTTADFGEGDDKKPLAVALKDFLKALPSSTHNLKGEFVRGSVNFHENLSHHERALALAKEKGISYEEAAHLTA